MEGKGAACLRSRPDAGVTAAGSLIPGSGSARPAAVTRAPASPTAARGRGATPGSSSSLPELPAGGVREEPGRLSSRHAARFVDRMGEVHDDLVVVAYVRPAALGHAVWLCRCTCGRQDCRGQVEWGSDKLGRRAHHWCGGERRQRLVAPPPPPAPPPSLPLPEGVRAPWDRPSGLRQMRDGELALACCGVRA